MCCIYILENKTSHEFVNYELKSVGQRVLTQGHVEKKCAIIYTAVISVKKAVDRIKSEIIA